MRKVYVAANEGNLGGGGFYWFEDPLLADAYYQRTVEALGRDAKCFRFNIDVAAETREGVTDELEQRFMAINFDYDRLSLIKRHPLR